MKFLLGGAFTLLFLAVAVVLTAYPLEVCWNYVMPYLFGLKTIGFFQAMALSVVSSALLKPYGGSK